MKKQLTANSSGWILICPKTLLELVGYNPKETALLITTKDKKIYIEPVNNNTNIQNKMIRKLQKNGSSYGLYFPNTFIEILEIDPAKDLIDININDDKIILQKA